MTTAPASPRTGQHSLFGWSLAALLREWSARVDAAADDLPQGTRGYQLLTAVVHGGLPSQAALAASLGIDRTVMTYLLDAFEECGLVERQRDPADRRARRVVATDHGVEVLTAMDTRVRAAENELLASLEPAQRTLLRELLELAATGAGPDTDPCRTVAQAVSGHARNGDPSRGEEPPVREDT